MIDSMIEPQPGESRGINTINEEGPGLQKKEPDAGTALTDRDPNFKCAYTSSQFRQEAITRSRSHTGPAHIMVGPSSVSQVRICRVACVCW